jgi:biopolymer transport protein ExbB/biopolymer transport protein TolQ
MDFDLVSLWQKMGWVARLVVILLALMAVYSLGIALERWIIFLRARRQSLAYALELDKHLSSAELEQAAAAAKKHQKGYLARVLSAGINVFVQESSRGSNGRSKDDFVIDAEHALQRAGDREIQELKRGLGVLASVGSTAPFIGLFGTVMGIVNAFSEIGKTGSAGFATVSAGIAEALITTAFGIAVAIPAVMLFNYFTNRVEAVATDINEAASALVDHMRKRF